MSTVAGRTDSKEIFEIADTDSESHSVYFGMDISIKFGSWSVSQVTYLFFFFCRWPTDVAERIEGIFNHKLLTHVKTGGKYD